MDWRFQKGGCLKEKWDAIVSRREMDVGKNTVQFRAEKKKSKDAKSGMRMS